MALATSVWAIFILDFTILHAFGGVGYEWPTGAHTAALSNIYYFVSRQRTYGVHQLRWATAAAAVNPISIWIYHLICDSSLCLMFARARRHRYIDHGAGGDQRVNSRLHAEQNVSVLPSNVEASSIQRQLKIFMQFHAIQIVGEKHRKCDARADWRHNNVYLGAVERVCMCVCLVLRWHWHFFD